MVLKNSSKKNALADFDESNNQPVQGELFSFSSDGEPLTQCSSTTNLH